jgi:cob(I)alamin adenosyltransferase
MDHNLIMSQIPKASVYTKKGDLGTTSLVDGSQVSKYHPRVQAYGDVDELNCFIGQLVDQLKPHPPLSDERLQKTLFRIQNHLFNVGSLLACEDRNVLQKLPQLKGQDVDWLEKEIDFFNHPLPQLNSFILPGGHPASSAAHICRTICRRAERHLVGMGAEDEPYSVSLVYLNRLSDFFFILARWIHLRTQTPEIKWDPQA